MQRLQRLVLLLAMMAATIFLSWQHRPAQSQAIFFQHTPTREQQAIFWQHTPSSGQQAASKEQAIFWGRAPSIFRSH